MLLTENHEEFEILAINMKNLFLKSLNSAFYIYLGILDCFFFISVPMRVAFDTLKIFFFMPLRSRTDEALFFTDFVLCIMLNSSCLFSEKEHLIVSIIQKLWYLRICNFFQFCWKFMSGHPSCSVEKWEGTCTIT